MRAVDRGDFIQTRRCLGKTQVQLAGLLGVSPKAVQSFEQGWRQVPAHVERQLLFLLYLTQRPDEDLEPCWERKGCEQGAREKCLAWEFQAANLCWFITGTMCAGEAQATWAKKMRLCRQCEVFLSLVPPVDADGFGSNVGKRKMGSMGGIDVQEETPG
jgi:hypothetical protein